MSVDPSIPDPRVLEQLKDSNIIFGRVVAPVPNKYQISGKRPKGEYAEHAYIGDAIGLTLADGKPVAASDHKFKLPNGLIITYGQINALAGDFYATYEPISDGSSDQDRYRRFLAAYDTLANGGPRQPKEANDILAVLQAEVDAVNKAIEHGQDPSVAYSTLPDVTAKLEAITFGRSGIPGYLGLAQINWDHFGEDARSAYNAGHATAIQKAIEGDLEGAYTMNAFADHFLEDSFSAGHLRTPRRFLHRPLDPAADLCSKFMHDEDCAIGLQVSNTAGESWKCYGDKRMLDTEDAENLRRCVAAVQASADEIYAAYSTKQAPSPSTYAAWRHAPTLESARSTNQELAKLFTFDSEKRKDIKERRIWQFKTDWWFWSTAAECEASGWWKYPIGIDGPKLVIPWSGISIVSPRIRSLRVFCQMPGGAILQNVHLDGRWTRAIDQPTVNAVLFTPLASINWDDGKEVRVYYLDREYTLQEYCYSEGGGWFAGAIGKMNIKTSTSTRIGAIQYGDDKGGVHIRVYYQEPDSLVIGELCNDGHWFKGELRLPGTLDGTSIAATTYNWSNQTQVRLYYQAEDLSLREHCYDNKGWYPGEWNPGRVQGRNPISAVAFALDDGGAEIRVYWRNLQDEIVASANTGSWGPATKIIEGIGSGFQFTALQWEQGKHVRLYYQNSAGVVLEHCSGDSGKTWNTGSLEVGGLAEQA